MFGITRAHLEEDAGKSVHGGADSLAGSSHTLVDFNRAGELKMLANSKQHLCACSRAQAGSCFP